MLNRVKKGAMALCVVCALYSCASHKQISYLQDVPENYNEQIAGDYAIRVASDDLIAILVNSKDLELAQMFNLPTVSYQINSTGGGYSGGQNRILGYLVDKAGCIHFPQLGVLKVRGMTRTELTDYIGNLLIEKGYMKDPIVTVQFLNFKVSVLGEVTRPGTFEVTGDRITLLDALSQAGDLTIYGKRENVKVIREENGQRRVATVDLRSANLLSSPYYYLRQNDVVYVEPNKAKAGQREINQNRTIGTFASILSVLLSVTALILR